MMLKYIYKKILKKISLSKKDLLLLNKKLYKRNICYGPFVQNSKMCPNTTALNIKLKRKFKDNNIVSSHFKKLGVSKIYLWLFYITFDIPAMLSNKYFERKLKELRETVDELVKK
ncbi:hypothetical protein HY212_02860 [Candidatus Pacearchaeota archaeon]|nr:hypothetical protein [Candidatus Pacearchaeota archaeon]